MGLQGKQLKGLCGRRHIRVPNWLWMRTLVLQYRPSRLLSLSIVIICVITDHFDKMSMTIALEIILIYDL